MGLKITCCFTIIHFLVAFAEVLDTEGNGKSVLEHNTALQKKSSYHSDTSLMARSLEKLNYGEGELT